MQQYNKFLSKVKRIIIPLPDFNFFHRASQDGDVDDKFVGRNNISAILENWLRVPHTENNDRNNKTADCTGSYLITGYRGMGKTSFVGKVIDKLDKEQESDWYRQWTSSSSKMMLALICMSPLFTVLGGYYLIHWLGIIICKLSDSLTPDFVLHSLPMICNVIISLVIIAYLYNILSLLFKKAPSLRRDTRTILKVKINIGNEVAEVRDVFSLFAYSLKDKLNEHISGKYIKSPTNIALRTGKYLFIAVFSLLLFENAIRILTYGAYDFYQTDNKSLIFITLRYLNTLCFATMQAGGIGKALMIVVGVLLSYGVSHLIWTGIKSLCKKITLYWGNHRYQLPEVYFGMVTNLCDRIDSSVDEDNSPYGDISITSAINIMYRRKKTRQYQHASVREIEYELIEIIKGINKSKLLNCRFIFVLDELDKLCTSKDKSSSESLSADLPGFTNDDNGMSDEMTANEKRHNTLKLLSQLKYFVSTAEAKFVFIAGHELYDAYKADVSDREFSISSIFNGVINVNSFFSYDSRIKDVTRMTETYLCKVLFGEESILINSSKDERDRFRLGEYRKRIGTLNADKVQEAKEVESVMCLLKQFVTYLTFVSNGAPKKLSARLERYIISEDKFNKGHNSGDSIVVRLKAGRQDIKYYLSLGYHDRQKVGFVHNMAAPIFDNIISPSSDYGDKFLVSSSFLIAHIYKHHKSGFSWRNLEYLPELMDTNRTPELREFISSIIDYLGKVHLTNITSGIFTYKFPMKLAEEIAIFTKKSDELSAIFNFSLDYFASVKKYYYRLIEFYTKRDGQNGIISSIHHNLGDIHMANDEFSEAIVQYRHAVAIIEKELDKISQNDDIHTSGNYASYIIRYARMMLKLGLAYEKRNTIDSAHMIYTRLCSRLIAYRAIDETKIGLTHYFENSPDPNYVKNNWQGKVAILTKGPDADIAQSNLDFQKKCYPVVIDKSVTDSYQFWMYGGELVNNLCEFLTPDKHSLITKLSVFEDLRIAYLPILAKLLALEKHNICGITKDNIKIAEAEFQHLYIITNSVDKYLLRVDFFRKLGDIMYYKNNSYKDNIIHSLMYAMECWGYDLRGSIFNYCYRRKMTKVQTEPLIEAFKKNLNFARISNSDELVSAIVCESSHKLPIDQCHVRNIIDEMPQGILASINRIKECDCRRSNLKYCPCYACKYYKRSLNHLKNNLLNIKTVQLPEIRLSDSICFWYALDMELLCSNRFNELIQTALSLESMGNVMLSCGAIGNDNINNHLNGNLLEAVFNNYDNASGFINAISGKVNFLSNVDKAILYYWAAMKYYSKAGNYKESMQALTKIFNTISSYDATITKHNKATLSFSDPKSLFASMEKVVKNTIRNISQLRLFDNTLETQKLMKILNSNGHINLGLTSILPEIEEMLLAYYEVMLSQLDDCDDRLFALIRMFYNSPSLTYLRNDSMIYNRVISLMFKARLNERVLSLLGLDFKSPTNDVNVNVHDQIVGRIFDAQNHSNKEQTLAFLISDSIFCLINITDFIKSSVKTTLFSDSFCYGVYKRLYYWIRWKEYVEKHLKKVCDIMSDHSKWLYEGHHNLMLNETYTSGMAHKHYEAAESMHSEGSEYQSFIRNMFIMDDDLQNNTCQFYFALERMKLNSNYFKDVGNDDPCNDSYEPDNYYLS